MVVIYCNITWFSVFNSEESVESMLAIFMKPISIIIKDHNILDKMYKTYEEWHWASLKNSMFAYHMSLLWPFEHLRWSKTLEYI